MTHLEVFDHCGKTSWFLYGQQPFSGTKVKPFVVMSVHYDSCQEYSD